MSRQVFLNSPFWLKKIRNAFRVYDADKSGTISIEAETASQKQRGLQKSVHRRQKKLRRQ